MALRFEIGDAQTPRGHAILYARAGGQVIATYCVVLPISFSIGKYLPPIFGQMPEAMQQGFGMGGMGGLGGLGAMGGGQSMAAMPIPPMLEDYGSYDQLRALAERRGDDLCDMGTLVIGDDSHRLTFAAEGAGEYGQMYATYQARWPQLPSTPSQPSQPPARPSSSMGFSTSRGTPAPATPTPLDDVDVEAVAATMMPERARLGELARLIGQARYAIDVGDTQARERTQAEMSRIARSLPEKYRAEQLVEAALRTDAGGPRLAELYLQRAYKLLDEAYIDIPPIEREIRTLRGEQPSDGDEQPDHPESTPPGQ